MLLLSIALILIPFAFLDKVFNNRTKRIIIILFSGYFIFLGGFRWLTGTDWYAYYYAFLNSDTIYGAFLAPHTMEWGYGFLNYIVNVLGGDYTIFLIVFTFLKVYLKYRVFISQYFINYALFSFFLFYCYEAGAIYGTRQTLAVSLIFLSVSFIIQRKFLWFLALVVLATLIHRTAIVFIFSYWIFNYKSTQQQLLKVFLFSIVLYFIFLSIDPSFLTNLPIISNFSSYQEKLEAYSELQQISYGKVDAQTSNILGVIKKMMILLPLILSFNNLKSRLSSQQFYIYRGLLNTIIFGATIYFVFGAMASDFKRMNAYFDIFEILAIPILLYNIRNKKLILLVGVYFMLIAFSKLYTAIITFEDLLDPFYFIFDLPFYRHMY